MDIEALIIWAEEGFNRKNSNTKDEQFDQGYDSGYRQAMNNLLAILGA